MYIYIYIIWYSIITNVFSVKQFLFFSLRFIILNTFSIINDNEFSYVLLNQKDKIYLITIVFYQTKFII